MIEKCHDINKQCKENTFFAVCSAHCTEYIESNT